MNIDWVIPCRYGEIHDNLATLVGAGIDTWWVPNVPAPIQVGIAVRLLATSDELGPGHEHNTRNIIRDPDGTTLSDLGGTFEVGAGDGTPRAEWLNGIALFTIIQFEAEREGSYSFEHIVDDSSKTIPLHIVQGPPPGAPPAA